MYDFESVQLIHSYSFGDNPTVADPGFGVRVGVNCHKQGRSTKWPQGVGEGGGYTPSPSGRKMEIWKCLEHF